jgi:hypothetical protein
LLKFILKVFVWLDFSRNGGAGGPFLFVGINIFKTFGLGQAQAREAVFENGLVTICAKFGHFMVLSWFCRGFNEFLVYFDVFLPLLAHFDVF